MNGCKLPDNVVHQYPSGRWGFVGHVDEALSYVTKDGQTPTAEQFDTARSFGPALAGLRPRTWASKNDALAVIQEVRS